MRPLTCVWEVTLACDCRCVHCGSAAGVARPTELTTAEALAVIEDLAALGCQTVALSGGEPLLRRDWPILARAVRGAGMAVELMSNGWNVAAQAEEIAAAGFHSVSLSVDGPVEVHDALRRPSSLARLLEGAAALRALGVTLGAVTQVNRRNLGRLDELEALLSEQGFAGWLIQLTLPMGRAKATGLSLAPAELPALEERLVELAGRSELLLQTADTIGYLSAREPRYRVGGASGRRRIWLGCQAGLSVLGLTSDGTVRGCLSQPPSLDEGNLRERSLRELWSDPEAFAYNRRFSGERLRGACARCALGALCRGGCTALAAVTASSTEGGGYCLRALSGAGGSALA